MPAPAPIYGVDGELARIEETPERPQGLLSKGTQMHSARL
ncbi:hypothetical protein ACPOL_2789 [Acidisarcina polymorpha]|uniref:Uncharacterized protein n=1 Tax=Acidisarcina polymorpha TaxID=2211140 RepID=A0A2Z5G041_9BACT|nr:hypothetical protein ACPOL_2789 [Acidisarcina polymorpha]